MGNKFWKWLTKHRFCNWIHMKSNGWHEIHQCSVCGIRVQGLRAMSTVESMIFHEEQQRKKIDEKFNQPKDGLNRAMDRLK